jgi:hypothetical protein
MQPLIAACWLRVRPLHWEIQAYIHLATLCSHLSLTSPHPPLPSTTHGVVCSALHQYVAILAPKEKQPITHTPPDITKVIATILEFAATVTGLCLHLRFGKWVNGTSITPSNATSYALDENDLSLNDDGLYLAPAVTLFGIFLGGFTIVLVLPL